MTTRAILVPQPPEPPKKPTWRDQLQNVKTNGPSGAGRKGRQIRRTIKPHIKQAEDKPPPVRSVDAQVQQWKDQSIESTTRVNGKVAGSSSSASSSSASSSPSSSLGREGIEPHPQQLAETLSYSFLGQSTVRYPFSTSGPWHPSSRGEYQDSKADKVAIEVAVNELAKLANVPPETLGDTQSYEALVQVISTLLKKHGPTEVRRMMAGFHRRQLAGSMPPLTSLAMQSLLPSGAVNRVNARVVSECTEWIFGPTTREKLAGPNRTEVKVVNVKKCRFLESSGPCACTSACKLPVQDVILTEFGVPVYMQPNFKDGSCRMFFGMEPLPENIDPALRMAAAARAKEEEEEDESRRED